MTTTTFDLHLHLDGSLRTNTVLKLMENYPDVLTDREKEIFNIVNKREKIAQVESLLRVSSNCKSLTEYLNSFDLPCRLLRTPEAMYLAVCDLLTHLRKTGMEYVEIRFAPQILSPNIENSGAYSHEASIIEAAISGAKRVMEEHEGIKANFILCCMRNLPIGSVGHEANIRTVKLAKEYLNKGVVAVDLAGAEARDATKDFEDIFSMAKNLDVPFTIHAGESGDLIWKLYSINSAIEFGAVRIGHGVAIESSPELIRKVVQKNITLECCPISNIQTNAISGGIKNHPIKRLLNAGVRVTVNTDNMTVSNTDIENEFKEIRDLGITENDVENLQLNAINAAFISEDEKMQYKAKIK